MLKSSGISLLSLFAIATPSLAQNTAWIGCYAIPPEPISGISISSSNTWTAAGCAGECRTLPDFGFSPTTYSYFSPVIEIGAEISTHCLCTNNVPDNNEYDGPSTTEDCENDNDYATLIDTPVTFQGCYSSLNPDLVVYDQLVNTYPECIEACSTHRWIAITHEETLSQVRCICSPFVFYDITQETVCDGTSSNYQIYRNDRAVQPSARAYKRRQQSV
ncbi:hypothetical protein I302_103178 [Kwoniella bestiolae CBS 10118]|uniref:WSC domain-containing protein n=1 Tax=Kwoniella bestiolae CBS 10118 TaxID=1296100 RepID=A0AAJ8K5K7_9TREE